MGPGAQLGDDFVMRYVGTDWKPIDMIESMLDYFLTVTNSNLNVDDLLNYGCWCQIGQTNSNFDRRHGEFYHFEQQR